MARVLSLLIVVFLAACSASVSTIRPDPQLRLRDYRNLISYLKEGTGAVSYSGTSLGQIESGQVMEGSAQAMQALEDLRFELTALGFNFVPQVDQADAVMEFSIGSIRYDPLVGWIADQAFVTFKNPIDGSVLTLVRAKSGFITPTVNNIVSNLAKSIKGIY